MGLAGVRQAMSLMKVGGSGRSACCDNVVRNFDVSGAGRRGVLCDSDSNAEPARASVHCAALCELMSAPAEATQLGEWVRSPSINCGFLGELMPVRTEDVQPGECVRSPSINCAFFGELMPVLTDAVRPGECVSSPFGELMPVLTEDVQPGECVRSPFGELMPVLTEDVQPGECVRSPFGELMPLLTEDVQPGECVRSSPMATGDCKGGEPPRGAATEDPNAYGTLRDKGGVATGRGATKLEAYGLETGDGHCCRAGGGVCERVTERGVVAREFGACTATRGAGSSTA